MGGWFIDETLLRMVLCLKIVGKDLPRREVQ